MKIQIRRGCFETNSSSTHCITISTRQEFDDVMSGKSFIKYRFDEGADMLPKDEAIEWNIKKMSEHFEEDYKFNELMKKYRECGNLCTAFYDIEYDALYDDGWCDFKDEADYSVYEYYMSYDEWEDGPGEYYVPFTKNFTSPSGDEMTAWGYYGNDY